MPYIPEQRRRVLVTQPPPTHGVNGPMNAGELNYQITRVVEEYRRLKGGSYQTCNDIVGALDNAKDEFRRRVQHQYEDERCEAAGDVYADRGA